MTATTKQGWLRHTAVAAVMGASLLWAGAAGAQSVKERCHGTRQTAEVESKTCPNGAVVKRACCTKTTEKGTKTHCKSFPHCPRMSPS
jgi:hypothetical protein